MPKTKDIVESVPQDIVQMIESVPLMSRSARQDLVAEATSVAELRDRLGDIVDWSDIEVSFDVVSAEMFENKPCIIGAFNFNESTKYLNKVPDSMNPGEFNHVPSEFVSLLVAGYDETSDSLTSRWVIINDGSRDAGIRNQIDKYVSKTTGDPRTAPAIKATKGFRKSEYPLTEEKHGTVGTGVTWFIG